MEIKEIFVQISTHKRLGAECSVYKDELMQEGALTSFVIGPISQLRGWITHSN